MHEVVRIEHRQDVPCTPVSASFGAGRALSKCPFLDSRLSIDSCSPFAENFSSGHRLKAAVCRKRGSECGCQSISSLKASTGLELFSGLDLCSLQRLQDLSKARCFAVRHGFQTGHDDHKDVRILPTCPGAPMVGDQMETLVILHRAMQTPRISPEKAAEKALKMH